MKTISEKKLKEEIEKFIESAIDDDVFMLYNKFEYHMSESIDEFHTLDDDDKDFIRKDLLDIILLSFEEEMVSVIKFYQIVNGCSFDGVTNHNPPRFKFSQLSSKAFELFLISEKMISV